MYVYQKKFICLLLFMLIYVIRNKSAYSIGIKHSDVGKTIEGGREGEVIKENRTSVVQSLSIPSNSNSTNNETQNEITLVDKLKSEINNLMADPVNVTKKTIKNISVPFVSLYEKLSTPDFSKGNQIKFIL